FQAEDGIRDFHVTGVQTCALPISLEAALRLGGHVTTASCRDGESALTAVEHSVGGFHAAVVDMQLPGMDGPETIRGLRERLPDQIGRASCRERGSHEEVGGTRPPK